MTQDAFIVAVASGLPDRAGNDRDPTSLLTLQRPTSFAAVKPSEYERDCGDDERSRSDQNAQQLHRLTVLTQRRLTIYHQNFGDAEVSTPELRSPDSAAWRAATLARLCRCPYAMPISGIPMTDPLAARVSRFGQPTETMADSRVMALIPAAP
jgi:hypothetical protein